MRRHGGDDALGNVVLHLKHILQFAFINFSPNDVAARTVDQLGRDAHLLALLVNASLQHVAHAKLDADLTRVDFHIAVEKARIAGDDEKPVKFRQRRQDIVGNAVGEIFFLRNAHILEWQYGDGWFLRQRHVGSDGSFCRRCRRRRCCHRAPLLLDFLVEAFGLGVRPHRQFTL